MEKKKVLNLLGYTLTLLGLIRIIQLIIFVNPVNVFWLCNHIPLILGLAILFRKPMILTSEFLFLFLGQSIWVFDLILGLSLSNYNSIVLMFLMGEGIFGGIFALILHLITLPLALYAIILIAKPKKNAWAFALIHLIILLPIALYFQENYNLNCFFDSCLKFIPNFTLYPLILGIAYFSFMKLLNFSLDFMIKKIR